MIWTQNKSMNHWAHNIVDLTVTSHKFTPNLYSVSNTINLTNKHYPTWEIINCLPIKLRSVALIAVPEVPSVVVRSRLGLGRISSRSSGELSLSTCSLVRPSPSFSWWTCCLPVFLACALLLFCLIGRARSEIRRN